MALLRRIAHVAGVSSSTGEVPASARRVAAPRGLLDEREVVAVAEDVRDRAFGVGLWWPPEILAHKAGFRLCFGFPERGERTTAERVLFAWHHDARERGMRIYAGIARAELLRRGLSFNDYDVWAVALELAVPREALFSGLDDLIDAQEHCPVEIIRMVWERFNAW